jgi:hypothetical protein
MAMPQGPVCEVRLLVVHRYPPGIQKLGSTPCEVEFLGRRGKPGKDDAADQPGASRALARRAATIAP